MIHPKELEGIRDSLLDSNVTHVAIRVNDVLNKIDAILAENERFDVAKLFVDRFNEVNKAVNTRDLSAAQFPRVGAEAMIELVTRRETLQWVLEMLNISE
jgi:hypothetical protein